MTPIDDTPGDTGSRDRPAAEQRTMRTNAEEGEVATLLRDLNDAAVRLWQLGCDPRFAIATVVSGALQDGVGLGSRLAGLQVAGGAQPSPSIIQFTATTRATIREHWSCAAPETPFEDIDALREYLDEMLLAGNCDPAADDEVLGDEEDREISDDSVEEAFAVLTTRPTPEACRTDAGR